MKLSVSVRSWLAKALTITTAAQTALVGVGVGPATAVAADFTPVVINEISPAGDWVELFANSDVKFDDAQGWSLVTTNGTSVRLTGTMTPGQFSTFTFATGPLGVDSGSVKLTHDGVDADMVAWGTERGAHVPGVVGDNTIARSDDGDGRWVSNAVATQNMSNDSAMTNLPPVVQTVKVPATTNSAVNVINNSSQSNVTVQAAWNGSGTLAVALLDNGGKTTGVTSAGSETLSEAQITGINAGGLNEGTAWAVAYTSSTGGLRSAWTSQSIWKDTIAPSTPSPMVAAGDKNGTDVVNQYNVAATRVSIGTPQVDATTMAATFTDGNAKTVSGVREVNSQQAFDLRDLADGALTLTVNVIDASGNVSNVGTKTTIGKDTTQPLPVTDLRAAAATSGNVVLSWDASPSDDVGSYKLYADMTDGVFDPNSPVATVDAGTRTYTTAAMPAGLNKFRINTVDRYGNEEMAGTTVEVTVSSPLNEDSLSKTDRTYDLTNPLRLWLQIADTTTGTANLSVLNRSTTNPTTATLPGGHAPVGKYFELGTDNLSIFPMQIRIFYTADDLAAAGVKSESQLEGIRFYDAARKSWQLYGSTGVKTTNVAVGNLVFDGYVWAMADHLTPIVASADIAAPEKPSNFLATAGDGMVKLTWDREAETAGYMVRYRQGTNDDAQIAYETVAVTGGDVTTVTLKGFENGALYEFGVASFDWVGNQSGYAVVEQTPVAAGSRADFVVPSKSVTKAAPSSSDAIVAKSEATGTSPTSSPEAQAAVEDSSTDQTVTVEPKGEATNDEAQATTAPTDEATQDETASANSRTLVTILIIVIAAAAGFGGYYGYQWWMASPEVASGDEPPVQPEQPTRDEEPKKKNGRGSQGGRW